MSGRKGSQVGDRSAGLGWGQVGRGLECHAQGLTVASAITNNTWWQHAALPGESEQRLKRACDPGFHSEFTTRPANLSLLPSLTPMRGKAVSFQVVLTSKDDQPELALTLIAICNL